MKATWGRDESSGEVAFREAKSRSVGRLLLCFASRWSGYLIVVSRDRGLYRSEAILFWVREELRKAYDKWLMAIGIGALL